jgi:hypothetical protein
MSSLFSARKTPALQAVPSGSVPRTPVSQVRVTTCLSGGSPAMELGRRHGCSGLAQPSSIAEGARLPSLYPR